MFLLFQAQSEASPPPSQIRPKDEEVPIEEDDPESDLDLDMEGVIQGKAVQRDPAFLIDIKTYNFRTRFGGFS